MLFEGESCLIVIIHSPVGKIAEKAVCRSVFLTPLGSQHKNCVLACVFFLWQQQKSSIDRVKFYNNEEAPQEKIYLIKATECDTFKAMVYNKKDFNYVMLLRLKIKP